MKATRILILVLTIILFLTLTGSVLINVHLEQKKEYYYFEDPLVCSGCHWDKFARWNISQHSKGFTGDFFQEQFYQLVLPSMEFDEKIADVNLGCIGCHSPSAFLSEDFIPPRSIQSDNYWNRGDGYKTMADRGIFCDFCHTIDDFKNDPPFNHDYLSLATAEIDPKQGDLEFPWSPHHETARSDIYEQPVICATCHNELNPYGVWVKATEHEYNESVYPYKGIVCQTCHMQPMGGKPAKMGILRPHNTDHWFGGGFTEFVEGAVKVSIQLERSEIKQGETLSFKILVEADATGHKFPTGSVEERDVWLHVTMNDANGKEIAHIPIPANPGDPNDSYFITTNKKVAYPSHSRLSEPFERDALPEGDRIYHSAFLDSDGNFTYAQWFAVKEIENRLNPMEEREEDYVWKVPDNLNNRELYLTAVLYYRRMPDPLADFLKIQRRPVITVSKDVRKLVMKD